MLVTLSVSSLSFPAPMFFWSSGNPRVDAQISRNPQCTAAKWCAFHHRKNNWPLSMAKLTAKHSSVCHPHSVSTSNTTHQLRQRLPAPHGPRAKSVCASSRRSSPNINFTPGLSSGLSNTNRLMKSGCRAHNTQCALINPEPPHTTCFVAVVWSLWLVELQE